MNTPDAVRWWVVSAFTELIPLARPWRTWTRTIALFPPSVASLRRELPAVDVRFSIGNIEQNTARRVGHWPGLQGLIRLTYFLSSSGFWRGSIIGIIPSYSYSDILRLQ